MSRWLIQIAISAAVSVIKQYGIPLLEKDFPSLTPLLEELLCMLSGSCPSPALKSAGEHFAGVAGIESDLVQP